MGKYTPIRTRFKNIASKRAVKIVHRKSGRQVSAELRHPEAYKSSLLPNGLWESERQNTAARIRKCSPVVIYFDILVCNACTRAHSQRMRGHETRARTSRFFLNTKKDVFVMLIQHHQASYVHNFTAILQRGQEKKRSTFFVCSLYCESVCFKFQIYATWGPAAHMGRGI